MKRCSTCNRTYTDPTLSFCIEDGTPLTPIDSPDESTVVTPREVAPYQPPGTYVPPGAPSRKRRVWPWVLGIGGAFLLGIIVISIAAAILVPRLARSSRERAERIANESRNANANEPANTNLNEPANANVSQPANANGNINGNVNATESMEVPPPTDHDLVLAQLRDLENEWTLANINADKKALDRILADDYAGQSENGLQSKGDYIRTIQRDTNVEKWKFADLKVTLAGDRATLAGNITYETQSGEVVFDFTDKFVWRDGRWQATGSEVKRKE